tara:strand:- start:247 stop:369 length:123 start_codon:yes stop_codon:yes gene_type:complete
MTQKTKIEELENKIKRLEQRISLLEAALDQLIPERRQGAD